MNSITPTPPENTDGRHLVCSSWLGRIFRNFEFGKHGAINANVKPNRPHFYWVPIVDLFRPNAMCSFIGWGYWYFQSVRWRDLRPGRFAQPEWYRPWPNTAIRHAAPDSSPLKP